MAVEERLRDPYRTQLRMHQAIDETDPDDLLAVHLHKAKYDQVKALNEYRSSSGPTEFLSDRVYQQSEGMVAARRDESTSISAEEAWTGIATEETWVGALPIQMRREHEDLYLRGYPFFIGFTDGKPRVVLDKILVENGPNLERVYVNEWARPWVIGEILDAAGFNTDDLILATLKAEADRYGETGLAYLTEIAARTVTPFVQQSGERFVEARRPPVDWEPDWQHDNVTVQLLKYDTDWQLYDEIGHGDSIRDMVAMFRGEQDPKGVPPDRGKTLGDVMR